MRFIGLAIMAAVLVVVTNGQIGPLFDVPSLIITLGFPLGMLIFGRAPVGTMFTALWTADADAGDLKAAAKGWGLARRYSIASGILGVIVGLIVMLASANDLSQIGPGLAMSMLTACYAVFFGYGIYLPLESRLEDRLDQ